MSFCGVFDGGSGAIPYGGGGGGVMPTGAGSQPGFLSNPVFASPGLSLGLQASLEGQGGMSRIRNILRAAAGGCGDADFMDKNKEDDNDSRSGSDNLDGISGDDLELETARKKKRSHRHTPQQIQELEAVFKECPHPDEKQRLDLSRRLCLESRQVKFWFQNRRTQVKAQIERHENTLLRLENDKLRAENLTIRDAMRSPICTHCGGPAMLGEVSLEEQHLRIENARLKDELDRVCSLAGKFLGGPPAPLSDAIPPMPCAGLELGVGSNGFTGLSSIAPASLPAMSDFAPGIPAIKSLDGPGMLDNSLEKSTMVLELALAAMGELIKLAQMDEPLWNLSSEGGMQTLNYDEYRHLFPSLIGVKPAGFVSEATKEVGTVIINGVALVETLMDANRWAEMFPCMISRAATADVISGGMGGTRNGALQLMHAELQVLSPLVPTREVTFLRFCKQHADGVWAVVDVSVYGNVRDGNLTCRRLPSGCVVHDMPNGCSKVTWVEHAEYDEAAVHQLYRPMLRAGLGFGARRWLATLQRRCQCLAILMSSSGPARDHTAITPSGRRSMMKLAQRMTDSFCAGMCPSAAHKWRRLDEWGSGGTGGGGVGDGVRMMTRQNVGGPGEPPGVVLSAATSVWLPVPPPQLFEYLRNERRRGEWDILFNGESMHEMAHIAEGQHHGNAVSLLRANAASSGQSSMLILQETCTDASGAMVVYAPVDVPAMHLVLNGGDSAYVALLPSGFAIFPDGHARSTAPTPGSLVTVAFQILVSSLPSSKLTAESVETVNNLLTCTVQKIKPSLQQP